MKIGDTIYIAVKTEYSHPYAEKGHFECFIDEVFISGHTPIAPDIVVHLIGFSEDRQYTISTDGKIVNIDGLMSWWWAKDYAICKTEDEAVNKLLELQNISVKPVLDDFGHETGEYEYVQIPMLHPCQRAFIDSMRVIDILRARALQCRCAIIDDYMIVNIDGSDTTLQCLDFCKQNCPHMRSKDD
jgi:hypothetical protein